MVAYEAYFLISAQYVATPLECLPNVLKLFQDNSSPTRHTPPGFQLQLSFLLEQGKRNHGRVIVDPVRTLDPFVSFIT